MSRRPARFTQADVEKALRAALKMDPPWAVEITPDGTIRIVPAPPAKGQKPSPPPFRDFTL